MLKENWLGFLNGKYSLLFLSIVGGLALGLGFLTPFLWWLPLVLFLPIFYILNSHSFSLWGAFGYGYFFGFAFIGTVHTWIWQTLPLSWIGAESGLWSVLLAFICWLSISLAQGFFIACFFAVVFRLRSRINNKFIFVITAAALWVFFEYLRMWGIAIFTWGEGSILSPHYSAGFLGYTVSSHHLLLQLASIGGVYLLSFVVVFINGLLWILVSNQSIKRRVVPAGVILILILSTSHIGTSPVDYSVESGESITVALIHTDFEITTLRFSDEEFKKRFDVHQSLVRAIGILEETPDVIVFPENGRFLSTLGQSKKLGSLSEEFGKTDILIIDSARAEEKQGTKGEIWYFKPNKGNLLIQEKYFLIPFGEYLPFYYAAMLKRFNQNKLAEIIQNRNYSAGEEEFVKFGAGEKARVGALACSEILSPSLYSDSTIAGANILANLSSHGVFHHSKIMHYQALNMAKVRAVENNRYFIRAANLSPAFVLDNRGRVVGESAWGEAGVLLSDVSIIEEHSVYNRLRQLI